MEPLVPTLTFEQLRQAKKNASKSLELLGIELSSSTTGNMVANVLGYQNWNTAKAITDVPASNNLISEYSGLKLKEAYLSVIESATTILGDISVIRSEGERFTTFIDKGFGSELHFSLPIPPSKEIITANIIGLYVTLKIPFYVNIGFLIVYDGQKGTFSIKQEMPISSFEVNAKRFVSNDGVFNMVRSMAKAFKEIYKKKENLIANLLSNRFYEGKKHIEFNTLLANDAWDNRYSFYHDKSVNVVYINDITGTNLTSAINNIEKIYGYFNPKDHQSRPRDSLVLKFKKWLQGDKSSIADSRKDVTKGTTEVFILFKNLDNRDIVIMDHEFNQIRGISSSVIQDTIIRLLEKKVPLNKRHSESFNKKIKSIVDKHLNEFMEKNAKYSMEDSHFTMDIFNKLLVENEDDVETVTIDSTTTILGIPSEPEKVWDYTNRLLNTPPTHHLYEDVYYLKEFNIISYFSGGTHRLAALNLYFRQHNTPFVFAQKKIHFVSIDTELLNRYRIDNRNNILFVVSQSGTETILNRRPLSPLLYDLITTLQVYYFGKVNFLSDNESVSYEKLWGNREKSSIEQIQELYN